MTTRRRLDNHDHDHALSWGTRARLIGGAALAVLALVVVVVATLQIGDSDLLTGTPLAVPWPGWVRGVAVAAAIAGASLAGEAWYHGRAQRQG